MVLDRAEPVPVRGQNLLAVMDECEVALQERNILRRQVPNPREALRVLDESIRDLQFRLLLAQLNFQIHPDMDVDLVHLADRVAALQRRMLER